MITYGFEPLLDLLANDRLAELIKLHWAALANDKEAVLLRPDWRSCLLQEQQGLLRAFVARRDGRLVGYMRLDFYRPDPYPTSLYVRESEIWVVPEEGAARGLIWRGMWRAALKQIPPHAKVLGNVRVGNAREGAILESLGFKASDVVYTRVMS